MPRTHVSVVSFAVSSTPSRLLAAVLLLAALIGSGLGRRPASVSGGEPDVRPTPMLDGELAYVSAGNVWLKRDGEPAHQVANLESVTAVRWSPGGTSLFVTRAGKTLRFRADGTPATFVSGLWAPDDAVVAVMTPQGGVDLTPADGGFRASLIPPQAGIAFQPVAWTSDGSVLALHRLSLDDRGLPAAQAVWLIQRDGQNLRELLPAGSAWPEALGWSPDNRWLVAWRGPAQLCVSCRADGQPLIVVAQEGGRMWNAGTVVRRDGFCWTADSAALVASIGGGRESYRDKRLVRLNVVTGAISVLDGDSRTVAIQPACAAADPGIAYTRAPALDGLPYENLDAQHGYPDALLGPRRVFLLRADADRPEAAWPPAPIAEEAPRWAGPHTLLFVRWSLDHGALPTTAQLWLGDTDDGAQAPITASLGTGVPLQAYFGDLGWSNLFAWRP